MNPIKITLTLDEEGCNYDEVTFHLTLEVKNLTY